MSSYQSNLIVYLVFISAFIVLHLAQAQSDVYQKNKSKHIYCGRKLSEAIARACYDEEMAMDDDPYAYDYLLRSRPSANALMRHFGGPTFRRQIRGAVEECCEKPCSVDDLKTYCGR